MAIGAMSFLWMARDITALQKESNAHQNHGYLGAESNEFGIRALSAKPISISQISIARVTDNLEAYLRIDHRLTTVGPSKLRVSGAGNWWTSAMI